MFLLDFDPVTTEVSLRKVADPQVIANFTEFVLTSDLQLTTGTVVVDNFMVLENDTVMTIEEDAVLELI